MKTFRFEPLQTELSAICMGTADFGKYNLLDPLSFSLLDTYVGLGGNWIDTAHLYADWEPGEKSSSEKQIGRWIKQRGGRHNVLIASKGAHPDMSTMDISRVTPEDIIFDLEEGLQVSGLDHFDLWYLHRDNTNVPVSTLVDCLEAQVARGLIRAYGVSNWRGDRIAEANAYCKQKGYQGISASQILYSAATPKVTPDPLDTLVRMDKTEHAFYNEANMLLTAFTSQAKGYLTKRAAGLPVSDGVAQTYDSDVNNRILALVQDIAAAHNVSVTAVSLAYISSQTFPGVPILGCRTVAQVEDCMKHSDFSLTADETAAINAVKFA